MKRSIHHGIAALAAAALLAIPSFTAADAIITLSNKRIDGTITQITDDDVTIRTDNYGELTFPKLKLKEIIKGDARSETSKKNNPFYGSTGGNPLGGSTSGNPFGGSTDTNPFSANSENIWGSGSVEINPMTGSVAAPRVSSGELDAVDFPAPAPRREVTRPEVPFSWDAVLFEVPAGCNGSVIIQPSALPQPLTDGMSLRAGAEIVTEECTARVVLKNGKDMLRLAPGSAIRIVTSAAEQVEVELKRGSVWADIAPDQSGRQFTIGTGNSIISARQGVLRVVDALDHGFHVAVVEGRAHVVSRKAQIVADVPAGNMIAINPAGVLSPNKQIARIIEHEDANFDSLDAAWWLRIDRLGVDRRQSDTSNLVSMNQLRGRVREVGNAFLSFVEDTGYIPTAEDAFSVLRENRGNWPGWKGPYWDGSLPPLDSWGRPMRYTTRKTGGQNVVGIVYSTGEDNADNQGDPSADIPEMLLYYQLDNIAQKSVVRNP